MKPYLARFRATSLILVAFSSVAIGCAVAPDSPGAGDRAPASATLGAPAAEKNGIFGTSLYEKNLGSDHVVGFYEFEPGRVAIRESMSIDHGEKLVLDGTWKFDSLADVFKKLDPDAAAPPAIVDADRRAAQLRSTEARQGRLQPLATKMSPASESKLPSSPAGAPAQDVAFFSTAASCSGDAYGDGWGATWFLNNYCNAGGYRWCPTNYLWANSGEYSAGWTSWRQMEGDFNLPGHISGTRISCTDYVIFTSCGPRTQYMDYDVLPRHIESWTFNDGNDRFAFAGTSQCGHQHTALLKSF